MTDFGIQCVDIWSFWPFFLGRELNVPMPRFDYRNFVGNILEETQNSETYQWNLWITV